MENRLKENSKIIRKRLKQIYLFYDKIIYNESIGEKVKYDFKKDRYKRIQKSYLSSI